MKILWETPIELDRKVVNIILHHTKKSDFSDVSTVDLRNIIKNADNVKWLWRVLLNNLIHYCENMVADYHSENDIFKGKTAHIQAWVEVIVSEIIERETGIDLDTIEREQVIKLLSGNKIEWLWFACYDFLRIKFGIPDEKINYHHQKIKNHT